MKTTTERLDKLAAKFNLYRADQIPAKYWEDEYFAKTAPFKLERAESSFGTTEIPEHLKTMQGVEIGKYYECRQHTRENFTTKEVTHELYHIDHSYILVIGPESDILMMLKFGWNAKGKYDFFPYYGELRKFQGIDNSLKQQATKDIKAPNNIGSFTDAKVNAWFKYCQEYHAAHVQLAASLNEENTRLEQEREEFILQMDGATVKRCADNSTVWINWKGFQITFNHNKASKYMSKTVEYRGNMTDVLELFKKVTT